MYTKVEPWIDLVDLEHRVQKFWDDTQAFAKLRQKNAGKKPWSFIDGPITANNPMGVHHAWGRTLKDAYQRYWAMNGCELRYQNGFDCQGLWVEVEVEKQLGFNSKREIVEFGVDKFVELCKERVRKYSAIQSQQSVRLGYWMDWNNSYYTMSDENNYTIWSFLKKCHERGKVYRGTDVMPWSGRSGTGYSQMEVVEGRRLVAHEAIFLKFPLKGRDKENLLVWTTTPWTLTSNVAAMVNAELEYVRVRCLGDGEIYIFANDNLRFERLKTQYAEGKEWIKGLPKLKTLEQVLNEKGGYEVIDVVRGADLLGLEYTGPFDEMEAQGIVGGYPFGDKNVALCGRTAHRVIDGGRDSRGAAVVVAGEGTGIVHTAPGCGDIDHEIGMKLGLPQIAPLSEEAKFLPKFEPLTGQHALAPETVKWIIRSLKEKGLLFYVEQYPHVYPHCWRSGDPLVFRLVDEWYINMDWRDEIKEIVKGIKWVPEWGQERELEWLSNMRDWMISKKRFWGLALPIWVCDECGHFDVIGGKEELKSRAVEGWDEFKGHSPHKPWIDKVKIKCEKCGAKATRVPDVGNPWLDAGIVPYSTTKYNTDRDYWKKWVPADLVLECFPGQFRNWFYSMLAMSTMMEGVPPFKALVGHALVRDEHGAEMHKSLGNAIWFDEAAEKMGADIMRWIYCTQEPTINLNFGYGVAREVRGKFFNTFWNTYAFFVNYARLENYEPKAPTPVARRSDFDRWILATLNDVVRRFRAGFEAFDTRSASRAVEEAVEALSNWYVRHCRRRFWKGLNDPDGRAAFDTLYESLVTLTKLLAPIMPFTSEEIYQNLVRGADPSAPESVHHCELPTVDATLDDPQLLADMAAIERLTSLALSAREKAKLKVRQPLALLRIAPADENEARGATRFVEMLKEDLNVKAVEVLPLGTPCPLTVTVKANFKTLGKRLGGKMKATAQAVENEAARLSGEYARGAEAFALTVEGEALALGREDLLVTTQSPEDQSVAAEGASWLSFDTRISEALKREGLCRELLRRLQVQRKDTGLEIEDRIHVRFAADEEFAGLFVEFKDVLADELLALSIEPDPLTEGVEYTLDGHTLRVAIVKA